MRIGPRRGRGDGHRGTAPAPQRFVVLGAGLAGLLAAAAVAGEGRSVLLLDRDDEPEPHAPGGPAPRDGVPQSHHPHVFLHRGLLAAERLLPGLRADLVEAGGVPFETGELAWLGESGWEPVGRRSFEVVSLTRPLLEQVVRRRVLALPGVGTRWRVTVEGLERGPGAGWTVRTTDGALAADVVVDASGRNSRMPVWLADLGLPVPPVEEVDARCGYASRMFVGGRDLLGGPGVLIAATAARPVGGIALAMEGGRWLVGAVGYGREHRPPRDEAGWEAFLRALPDPAVADLAARATPVGDIAVHRQTANRWRHYERSTRWPDGLVVLGDALCAFDPVYGQGITVAALEAGILHDELAPGRAAPAPGWSRRLHRRFARVVAFPWAVAAGEDLRFMPGGNEQRSYQRLLGAWARHLARMSVHGNELAGEQRQRVYHLMGSPLRLFHPALVAGALGALVTGEGPAAPRPAFLGAPSRPLPMASPTSPPAGAPVWARLVAAARAGGRRRRR